VCGEENISVGHMYTCVLISVKRKRVIYIYINGLRPLALNLLGPLDSNNKQINFK